jgi:hypothetical protein
MSSHRADISLVSSRDGEVGLGGPAIDVRAVVNAVDPDGLCAVVDAVEESVGPAAGAVLSGEFTAQWFPDSAGHFRSVLSITRPAAVTVTRTRTGTGRPTRVSVRMSTLPDDAERSILFTIHG